MNTPAELSNVLRSMGLTEGDSVIVHSSFRSLKPFDDGPREVVDAILNVIGPNGNLMLPTFNYSSPPPEPYYDPRETPCRTGAIAELGRQRADAVRSLHPTHSVAVIGPEATALTEGHLHTRTFGPGCPVDRLARCGGKVLLLGMDHTTNSMIHVAEEHAQIPKPPRADPTQRFRVRKPDGSFIDHLLDSSTSCSLGFETAARVAQTTRTDLGNCVLQLMNGQTLIDDLVNLLHEQPTALLCDRPDCHRCRTIERNLS